MEAPFDGLLIKGVFLFPIFKFFVFGPNDFYLEKLRIIQLIFELACRRRFSGEQ